MRGRLLEVGEVGPALARRMFELLARHFAGVEPGGFAADLAEKGWVVLLEDGQGRLAGFSTLLLQRERWGGGEITVVHSGDTIVEPAAWGTPELPRTWIRAVRQLHQRHGAGPLWWLLITSGFRTYRFLPVFCRRFHPSAEGVAGSEHAALAEHLARGRFGRAYDPAAGIVRFARPQVLRPGLEGIPEARRADPHVAFFARANPGHGRGDELVSLASLEDANLTAAGLRMLHGAGVRRVSLGPPAIR